MSEAKTKPKTEGKAKSEAPEVAPSTVASTGKLAAVQIRGLIGAKQTVKDTMKMLNLQKKNSCVVLEDNPVNRGMLIKSKDYLTYGEVTQDTIKELKAKRDKGKKYYNLSPPRGGFERKGIKKPYNLKGALGYRGKNINELIKKMI